MDAGTLAEAMGYSANVDYTRFAEPFTQAMRVAGITTVNRAAMWCAQIGHESAGLRYMEEIASGAAYEGRVDLGNTQPGDGRRFKGSGPIQLTGRHNFRAFTRWANANGHTTIDFEAQPHLVREDPRWGFLAASWYWTAARPQLNALSDANNLEGATRAINGGLNGLADRNARWHKCFSMGGRLLQGEGGGMVEKVLQYSRDQVHQDTFYNCGPASVQTVLRAATGQLVAESVLGRELGTHTGGTDWIGQVTRVLNARMSQGAFRTVDMPNDPPSSAQKESLWSNVTDSINAGFGVVANIVAPPSNYPRAVAPSTISPAYGGGTVYHYIAIMGYSESGGRRYWIADSGFSPFGYWVSHEQLCTLIPPKGYSYSSATAEGDWSDMASKEEIQAVFYEAMKVYLGPLISDTKDLRYQLTGSRDSIPGDPHASYPGHPQLGQNAEGHNLTPVDGVAALRRDVAELMNRLMKLEGKL